FGGESAKLVAQASRAFGCSGEEVSSVVDASGPSDAATVFNLLDLFPLRARAPLHSKLDHRWEFGTRIGAQAERDLNGVLRHRVVDLDADAEGRVIDPLTLQPVKAGTRELQGRRRPPRLEGPEGGGNIVGV